ncbi:hypothetical protein HS088_TW22G00338 [Tripterygium wilfordii]|uniref:Uncharacterized protein n=1 Tax=Tripterygium wilfordii TaxID=458696 RepID=A0A7J7BYG1_TRIWF|nr:uncharacterized protein LOC119991744 [Tripterygium wilfordii]KAF5726657.1 hypothetical protein HS088_TW22G00338 [Tripterygium wilfordii]
MPSNQKLELINQTIQKLIEEDERAKVPVGLVVDDDDDVVDDQFLVSKLLSQMELVREEGDVNASEASTEPEVTETSGEEEGATGSKEISTEEIVKELRTVRRQNTITHILLSVLIALTVTWQVSEVSLILKIKNGLSHPFRSFGGVLAGILQPSALTNAVDAEKQPTSKHNNHDEGSSFSPLKMPELPHMDLPGLGFEGDRN